MRADNDTSIFKKGQLPWWRLKEGQLCVTPTLLYNLDSGEIFSQGPVWEAYKLFSLTAVSAAGVLGQRGVLAVP